MELRSNKTCGHCKKSKPYSEFHKNRAKKDGHAGNCKICFRDTMKSQWVEHKDRRLPRIKARRIKTKYNLTFDDVNRMLSSQEDKCPICEKKLEFGRGKIAIDHCHATGKIRSILCHQCNVGIGMMKENPNILRNAALYLESFTRETEYELAT